jgi:16S rRNA (uracil1498-N3)-methyltransferase
MNGAAIEMNEATTTAAVPRFFVEATLRAGATLALPADVARHAQVLRLEPGDALVLFDGSGGQYRAQLVEIDKRNALAQLDAFEPVEAEPPYRVTLAQGIAGGDKMDWVIEKAVELGVAAVVPLTTARGVVKLSGERADKRVAHWRGVVARIVRAVRAQPRAAVRRVLARLDALPAAPADGELRLLLSPRASIPFASLPDQPPAATVTLLIGPEGGLSPDEENAARAHGFTALSLGPRVLRTETPARPCSRRWPRAGAGGDAAAAARGKRPQLSASRISSTGCARPRERGRKKPARRGLPADGPRRRPPHLRLRERIEHAERDLALGPELRGLAEHVEQRLAPFLVELLRDRQPFEDDHETGLCAGLRDEIGQAVVQRVVVLAEML